MRNNNPYNSQGGIIYNKDHNSQLIIIECIFYKCSCNNHGGAIYYQSSQSNSGIIINKTCANECIANNNYGQFSYLYTTNTFHNLNYLSICKCGNINNGYSSIYCREGKQNILSLNCSLNNCYCYSSIYIYNPNEFLGKYWTIVNNLVTQNTCIYFYSTGSNKRLLLNCNIINNNSPTNTGVFYLNSCELYIQYSIFLNNQNNLFYLESNSKLFLENNLINHNSGNLYSGSSLITNNNNSISNQNYNTLILIHFPTYHCHVDYLNIPKNSLKFNNFQNFKNFNLIFIILFFLLNININININKIKFN